MGPQLVKLVALVIVAVLCRGDDIKTEDNVLVLTSENFDKAIEDHKLILVEFYAPWCGHCQALKPEYAKAATKLAEEQSEIKLAMVDATAETALGEKYNVRGFPTLKFFREGKPIEYNGGRTSSEIIRWLKKKSGSPVVVVDDADALKNHKNENEVLIVGFFKDQTSESALTYIKAASEYDDQTFLITSSAEVFAAENVADNQIVLFKKFDEGRNVLETIESVEAFKEFYAANSMPIVNEFSHESASRIFGGTIKTHSMLFMSKKSDLYEKAIENFRKAAEKFRGKVIFVFIDTDDEDNSRILDFFNLVKKDTPQMRMIKLDEDMMKFKPEDENNLDPEAIASFVQGVLDGKIRQHLYSQPLPDDWDAKPVKVLVVENFDKVAFDKSKDVLVEFYAPWCGHCKQLEPIYAELAESLKDRDDIVIAKMDATANEMEHTKIASYPTIKLYKKGTNEVVEYNGERKLDGLKKFIETGGEYGKAPEEDIQEDEEKVEDDEHAPRDEL